MDIVFDALGNEIELNKYYAYSASQNGIQTITIGKVIATSIKDDTGKVTFDNVHQRKGIYGKIDESFTKEKNKKTFYACLVFPILTLAEHRDNTIKMILADG